MATIRDLAKKVRDEAKKNRESSENKARQDRLSNATLSSNTAFTSAAKPQAGLSKPAKITSDVSGEAWTRATPSQVKLPSGYTVAQQRDMNRLQEQRRRAQVDMDLDTMNAVDKRMKEIRKEAGKQTFGDRASDTASAVFSGSAGAYTNVAGFASNALHDPDYNRRQIAQAEKALSSGKLSDGRTVTPAMRKTLQDSIDRMNREISEWESENSLTNRIYRTADRMQDDSAAFQESAKQGLGKVGSTIVDAAVSMGQSTLDAVPAIVTGGAAGMAPFVVRAFGGSTQEARRKGADLNQQFLYGSVEAAKEYVTEKLFGLTLPQKMMGSAGAGSFDDLMENGVRFVTEKLAKSDGGQKVIGGLATWLMSGATEGLEEVIGSALENAFINPNLRPWEPDTRTTQEKFNDALYDGLVGAVSGLMGGVTNLVTYDTVGSQGKTTARSATSVDARDKTGYNETKVSPAASAQVQQTEVQAQVTQAENPGSTVLDAATTLFTQRGMKLKTAQEKAGIVQKLLAGEDVSVRDINKLNPTSKESQAIFTQLTGVQFPEGKVTQEQLYNLYRSANTAAVEAREQQVVQQQAREAELQQAAVERVQSVQEQQTPTAQQYIAQHTGENDAQAVSRLAQMRGEIAPDGNALLSFKEFSDFVKQQNPKATREETARLYDQYLKDNQTVEFRGQRLSHMQFMDMVRNAPTGAELTEAEAEDLWQREVKRQQDLNYNKEDSRNGQGQSAVYGAGLQGQSDQRSGMDAGGLYEVTGRAESESGTRGEYGTRSEGAEAVPGGHGEGSGGLLNNDAPVRTSTAADGRTVFNEVSEAAWSEDMKRQTQKFSRVGIRLRAAVDRIPIPGTNRYCDGVSHLGVESIVQSDSPFFAFEQLCDHEAGHQYFFRDRTSTHTNLYKRCVEAYKNATTAEQRQAMFTSYLGEYADVYAQADKKTRDQLRADIREEIICDAYAGMNRNGYGADQLQGVIKPIIDEWCAQRDAEMQTTEQKYSIDSMAEAVGLTFEKDGQVTVFKDAKGNAVDEVTEDHIRKSPLGAVIQSAVDANLITKEQAGQQVKFFSDLYNMMLKTQDIDLLWAVSSSIGFQPLESGPRDPATVNQKSRFAGYTKNSDPQYSTTVDFTTICVKTQAIIDAMSETMMRLGRGLTEDEIVNVVYKNTHEAGEPVPCPVCYVFSRWVGLGGLFNKMNQLQVQYANADETVLRRDIAELEDRIYDIMVERGYEIKTDKKTGKPKLNGDAREAMYKELVRRKNELSAKQNLERLTGETQLTAAENAELDKLNNQIEILDNWTWLRDVRLSENYEPVPSEILFNINAGKEFAEQYPESWKYRTTRGPAMGKAATPYADEHLGQILRGAGISDLNDAGLGDPKKNPFLKGKNGKLTPAAQKALQKSRAKIKAQNLLNGQRYQSTSDFRFEYALDYLLSFVEMQSLGGKVQLYTKVAESVPMFASVNGEVNCSLMPLGIGYRVNKDGSKTLVFSSVTGMNAEDAFNLSAKYDNVQPIMVGVNNEHIRLCMADDRITFIIPYHASGASEGRYVSLMKVVGENVEERTDYSNYQTDHSDANATPEQKAAYDLRLRILTGNVGMLSEADQKILRRNDVLHNLYKRFYGKDVDGQPSAIDRKYLSPEARDSGESFYDPECFGVFLTKDQAKTVMPFEYWDRTSTIEQADANGQAFVDYCESIGLHPRFSGWDANGVYHADMDFSKDSGYWKMLVDRSAYNRDGSYHEQKTIDVTGFDAGFLLRDEAIKGIVQPSKVNDPGKTAEIVEKSVAEIQARAGKDDSGMAFYDTEKKYSVLVEDKDTLDFLNNQKTIKTYKTMQLVDGKLYPPMASRINGKFEDASELGKWEQATEHPELIKNGNKFKLDKGKGNGSIEAAYNPYMHSSNLVINDQFTGAYTRDNLVTVECEVPVSEVTSGYHAEYAKDSVGWHSWHTGTVAGQIRKEKGIERQVFLSRWIKPVRIVPDSEVASIYKTLLDGTDIAVPDNVVTPALRNELQKAGVKLQESGKVRYSITGENDAVENDAVENEKAIRKLENEIEDINAKLDLASVDGLSEIEVRRLRNQLTKSLYELDQRNAAERKAAVRTSLQTILDNLDNYRAIDLESIANQLTDDTWDEVETLSTEDLKSGIREIIQERAGDMSPLEMQSPKFGVYVRKPSTSAGVRYSVIDSDYMAAVERGDMETAQKMVDEAANEAFKDSVLRGKDGNLIKVYHGSPETFNVFRGKEIGGTGNYFSPWESFAIEYGDTRAFYLNLTNPAMYDYDWNKVNGVPADKSDGFIYVPEDMEGGIDQNKVGDTEIVVYDSNKIKSADPVTYDDNGKVIPLSERFQTTNPDIRYSITPEFEQWYKENFGGEDLTDAQLQRRLEYAKQKENDILVSKQAVKTKQDVDQRYKDLTAWMMYHKRKMREQRQTLKDRSKAVQQSMKADKKDALEKQAEVHKAELAVARDEKVKALKDKDLAWRIYSQQQARNAAADKAEALKTARKEANAEKAEAVRTTKEVERAKAEVQHDADMMAMKREAAKRLRIKEDAYQQKAEQRKENQKLKRNAAKQALRDSKLAAKKRAEAEVKQGAVDTIRKNPASRSAVEKLQERASQLRTLGRSAYRTFVNQALHIDELAKRQVEGTRASTLVTVLGGANDTVSTIYKNGLVDRAGNTIGESMKDVFLCWDVKGRKVDQNKQALLQDYMLHQHNVDRMSFVDRARTRLETFEQENPWLSQMDTKEFARLVAMTDAEIQSTGKQEAHDKAVQYARLLHEYDTAQNKPIFGDSDGNAVTADTSRKIVQQYLSENPWLEEKAQGIYDWWDKFMRTWAVGDSITETEYNTMRELYPHYVPTYRADKKGVGAANFVGANGASIGKAVKKAKGGMSEVLNIEDSFSNLVSKIVRLERTNELYMNMIDSAMLDNDDTFSDMIVFDWDWQDGQYGKTLEVGAILNGDLDARYDDAETAGLYKVGQDRKLTAWHNGRQYSAYVSEDLFKSIANVTGTVANDIEKAFIKAGNALTGPMKTAITGINPFFAVRNLSRDLPTAITNSISGMAFPKYWAQAAAEIAKNSENWQHFQALGGTNATYYNDQNGFVNGMEKGDGIASKIVGKMGTFNEVTEAQTRFAEYLATIDRLGDTYENRLLGIKNAAEVTVDFSRKGRAGKLINAWVPYWNPAVQGVDKVVRSVIDSPDGSAVWKQAARTVGRASMTTVLLEAILYAVLKGIGRYDDWEELDDRTKDTYYCIPYGKSNTFIKVPKNREWGAILGTPFMRLLEYANGRENPFENYIETSLEPNFLPGQILAPREGGGWQSDVIGLSQALDLQANKDFAGRTIVPYALEKGSRELQYNEDTSWFAKQLGALIHFSPMQIDYIITDYFGNFGDIAVMATSDAIINGTESLPEKFEDVVKNQFVVDNRKSNYVVSKYYDTLEQLDTVVQDRMNQLGADAYKETVEYQTKTAMDKLFGKQISELNKQVREAKTNDERMEIKGQIALIAEQALSYYEDCMSGKIQNPVLDAQYASLPSTVAKELERLDGYSTDYRFKPAGTPSKAYTDPKNKNKEYVLTDEQKDKFKEIYQEQYAQTFSNVIGSSKYKSASDEKKANLLENARDDVLEDTKDEFFKWLKKTGAKSTAKKK